MTILAIGAHPDDIELGCGGALLAHRRAGEAVWLLVMSAGTGGGVSAIRKHEQSVAARRLDAELLWGDFADGEIPLPPFWGGYRVVPDAIEFWQGRENRFHDRIRYERVADGWTRTRLAP